MQPSTILQRDDVVVVSGQIDCLLLLGPRFGTEVHDPQLLDFPVEALTVVLTNQKVSGPRSTSWLHRKRLTFRGIALLTLTRAGQEIPLGPMTVFNRGDVVEFVGPQRAVERVAGEVGYALHRSDATNLSTVGFGILAGALIGLPFVMVGDVKLTLSVSVGTLVAGLFSGGCGPFDQPSAVSRSPRCSS